MDVLADIRRELGVRRSSINIARDLHTIAPGVSAEVYVEHVGCLLAELDRAKTRIAELEGDG